MKRTHGFTVVELMVVVAIAAILASLAAPSFTRLIESNSLSSDVNTFLADMRFARNEAIKRGSLIIMCRSANPEAVSPANPNCTDGSDWKTGWIVFEDRNDTGTHTTDEPLLRQQGPLSKSGGIVTGSGGTTKFRFVGTGRLRAVADADFLTFNSTSSTDSASQRVICVNVSGRARIAGDGGSSCGATN
jgi:type IV fimbrial biogenesis protein FimT